MAWHVLVLTALSILIVLRVILILGLRKGEVVFAFFRNRKTTH
jgi:hypothetical protein